MIVGDTLHEGRRLSAPDGVTAVVLTHMRPRLAGDVTRSLVSVEGLPPERVIVVVNGEGGLDDPDLEARVRMVRLGENTGPAGGFRAGLVEAFADPATNWAYLCEDDVGLFDLPAPRLAGLLSRIADLASDRPRVGAVVAYGRRFVGRGSHTVNTVPVAGSPGRLTPVDVACWGATLISRAVVEAGVLPDPDWFFGLEDFDFFCRVREAGFSVLVDDVAAVAVAVHQTNQGRDEALRGHRPVDRDEPWRGVLPLSQLVRFGPSPRSAELVRMASRLLGAAIAEGARVGPSLRHRPRPLGRCPGSHRAERSLRPTAG